MSARSAAARALGEYRRVEVHSKVAGASPEALIGFLLEGLETAVKRAARHLERRETAAKGEQCGRAIAILEGLKDALNHEAGGQVAHNLERLYEYMIRRLLSANAANEGKGFGEVAALTAEIRAGWRAIEGVPRPIETNALV